MDKIYFATSKFSSKTTGNSYRQEKNTEKKLFKVFLIEPYEGFQVTFFFLNFGIDNTPPWLFCPSPSLKTDC